MLKRKYYFHCGENRNWDEFQTGDPYEDSEPDKGEHEEDRLDKFGRIWFRDYERVRRFRTPRFSDHLKCSPRVFAAEGVIHGHGTFDAFYNFITNITGQGIVSSIEQAALAALTKADHLRLRLPHVEHPNRSGPGSRGWANLCLDIASFVGWKAEHLERVPAIAGGFINFPSDCQTLFSPSIHSPTEILFPLRAGGRCAVIEHGEAEYRESGFVQILHALIGHRASVAFFNEPGAAFSIFWVEEFDDGILRINKFPDGQAMHTCTDADVVRIFSHLTAFVGIEASGISSGWFEAPEQEEGEFYSYKGDDYCPLKKVELLCKDGSHFICYRYSAEADEFPL